MRAPGRGRFTSRPGASIKVLCYAGLSGLQREIREDYVGARTYRFSARPRRRPRGFLTCGDIVGSPLSLEIRSRYFAASS